MTRQNSLADQFISIVDAALRSVSVPLQRQTTRANPAHGLNEAVLSNEEKRHVAGLMRVNHAGEVCAQALYQGQAMTAKLTDIREQMVLAADEEVDHLGWCEARLRELSSNPSFFNPVWYMGSFLIGLTAGWFGDQWSLGFVAETERQVTAHLQRHLEKLPVQDEKSKAILTQMQVDERHHADMAVASGAAELPYWVTLMMHMMSKLMTKTTYYL